MRISGVQIPNNKRIVIALRYIYGIGPTLAEKICDEAGINQSTRTKDITDEEGSRIQKIIERGSIQIGSKDLSFTVEGELKRSLAENLRRGISIKLRSAVRRMKGLPANGQRTKTNAKTSRKLGGIR